ncbi:MAG: hypothetical protein HKN13_06810, partial [Rhodothermales bacterium]|nr:hypothetical protein [Rhodothermales bacterium]
MKPFLMTLASDSDHWMFLLSNGGMTAGRVNPDNALLPYYTQDKILDLSGTTGSTSVLRVAAANQPVRVWHPFSSHGDWDDAIHRNVRKNDLGNHIILEETQTELGLTFRISWRPSERFGFVRMVEVVNESDRAVELQVMDGLRNIMPFGLNQRFQNEFSILGDAYKQTELITPENIGVYHLSSVPTDLAEPMESLKASVVWQAGLDYASYLVTDSQLNNFRRTGAVVDEHESRGKRGSYLTVSELQLQPKQSRTWYVCADVGQDGPKIEGLRSLIAGSTDLSDAIETDCDKTENRLRLMLASSDGLQVTAEKRRSMRHTSNTLFNVMRGGTFTTGYDLPLPDVISNVATFNSKAVTKLEEILGQTNELSCYDPWDETHPLGNADPDVLRLLREYLPLSFSRRHGDPSRPWNRFSIEIKEDDGAPRFFYQGNWRDIFQNWEALLRAYPEYTEATICRFLNSTTADGYNPYRVTKDGFDWEVLEPGDPWANIGYWGDHQIVYLLRLLETSVKFHPGRLKRLLHDEAFVYADIPYRIKTYDQILENPRETVEYDLESEQRIEERVEAIGADGKLLHTERGEIVRISLLEKLLNPLLAKLSNFVPGGGIWMNTQRPEWNDANNALVGYGISVVTLGYVARYIRFFIDTFGDSLDDESFDVSAELAGLLDSQFDVFAQEPSDCSPEERRDMMRRLGEPASQFRQALYEKGLSGERESVGGSVIRAFLKGALDHVNKSLSQNNRPESLWHSYNLLQLSDAGFDIRHLGAMLEGQVSILSSGLLDIDEVLQLLRSLRNSDLYRADQDSYLLYPNREMSDFLNKNRIPRAA